MNTDSRRISAALLLCVFAIGASTATAQPARNAELSPAACFDDVLRAKWNAGEDGLRLQALVWCAQIGSATLAVLDAVDRGAVPQSTAGRAVRELAFRVVTTSLVEVQGGYQAAGKAPPSVEQFRTYVSDDFNTLRTDRDNLARLVATVWKLPPVARTPFPAATQRVVQEWSAAR